MQDLAKFCKDTFIKLKTKNRDTPIFIIYNYIMYLLAISGGPDSMYLLNKYKRKKIIVAHVNYHKRLDSDYDQKVVENFCQKHHIKYEVLHVKSKPQGNFQTWARKIRYDFFRKLYLKYDCQLLITAHHKDDFLETALMQQQSQRTPRFFGIRHKNKIQGMKIKRPLVKKIYKQDIITYLNSHEINFATDSTNDSDEFTRNKIRKQLLKKTLPEKESLYNWFKMSNKILKKKFAKIDFLYRIWKHTHFEISFFKKQKKYQTEILFKFIHENFEDVKISTKKLESLSQFINGKDSKKEFKLNEKNKIKKEKNRLFLIK